MEQSKCKTRRKNKAVATKGKNVLQLVWCIISTSDEEKLCIENKNKYTNSRKKMGMNKEGNYFPSIQKNHKKKQVKERWECFDYITSSKLIGRKIYRGGGYCHGLVVCDQFGNPLDNRDFKYNLANGRFQNWFVHKKHTSRPRSANANSFESGMNLRTRGITLPKISKEQKRKTSKMEYAQDMENIRKILENGVQRVKKRKDEVVDQRKMKQMKYKKEISIEGKFIIPNELMHVKTMKRMKKK